MRVRIVAMAFFCIAAFWLTLCVLQDRAPVPTFLSGSVGAITAAAYIRPGVVLRILG